MKDYLKAMDTKSYFKYYRILLFMLVVITFTSCIKPKEPCTINYQFSLPINILPPNDTFKLGDTFYIEYKSPIKMYNLKEGQYVSMQNFGFSVFTDLYKITDQDSNRFIDISTPGYNNSISRISSDYFDFKSIIGKIDSIGGNNTHAVILENSISQDSFFHKSAFILKDTGLFYFQFRDVYANFGNDRYFKLTESECTQYYYEFLYTVNNKNTNIELLSNRGITPILCQGYNSDAQKHNFEQGSWSFVVVP